MVNRFSNLIKTNFKKIIFLSLLPLILGGLVGYFIFSRQKPAQFETKKAQKRGLSLIVSASGEITSEEEATLKFQTSGRLSWVGVKKGDKVKKWQSIACLDQRELQKTLEQELLDYMNELWDHEQTEDDYQDAAVTETIRRIREKSGFDLDRVVLDVELADIALKYACISSPIAGIVTEIDAPHPGVNIVYTAAEFVVSNPNKLVFSADIDEIDIGKIKEGQTAKILLDAFAEEEIFSSVSEIDFTATTTSGGGTAFVAKFVLPPNTEDEKFKLGMNGDVEVLLEEKSQILAVPFEAVQEDEEGEYVWLVEENQPKKKSVKTSEGDDTYTIITDGLSENDLVVVSGFKNIEDQ